MGWPPVQHEGHLTTVSGEVHGLHAEAGRDPRSAVLHGRREIRALRREQLERWVSVERTGLLRGVGEGDCSGGRATGGGPEWPARPSGPTRHTAAPAAPTRPRPLTSSSTGRGLLCFAVFVWMACREAEGVPRAGGQHEADRPPLRRNTQWRPDRVRKRRRWWPSVERVQPPVIEPSKTTDRRATQSQHDRSRVRIANDDLTDPSTTARTIAELLRPDPVVRRTDPWR